MLTLSAISMDALTPAAHPEKRPFSPTKEACRLPCKQQKDGAPRAADAASMKKKGLDLRPKPPPHPSWVPSVTDEQAVLLARFIAALRLPRVSPSDILQSCSPHSGGTAPASTGFPIKSCDTCSSVCDFAGPLNESVFLEKCPIDSCYYTMPKSNYQAQQTKKGCRL